MIKRKHSKWIDCSDCYKFENGYCLHRIYSSTRIKLKDYRICALFREKDFDYEKFYKSIE